MRKWIIAFFIGGVMGTAFGVAVGFFIFPYVFPPPPAMETLTAEEQTEVVAQGHVYSRKPPPTRSITERGRLRFMKSWCSWRKTLKSDQGRPSMSI